MISALSVLPAEDFPMEIYSDNRSLKRNRKNTCTCLLLFHATNMKAWDQT